ncbi:MAG: DNA-processing protein DprA [Bacteroidaceae bacterium]|nr:DNA-processing protein DprA [Bacteroidaceae bacterium]
MTDQETLYMMALTQVPSLSLTNLHLLIDELGSASAIYENRKNLKQVLPSASPKFLDGMGDFCNYLKRAEEELEFCRKGKIRCLGLNDEDYPQRLKDCNDAPVLLYYRGSANLNSQHIVSMVGTRQITNYGKDLCRSFVRDLKQVCPDALVVSGLAYGVDVNCHRAALEQGLETVGVLAHGLDQIYPRHHRETAKQMVDQGGLLTEYMSNTIIDKRNFVQRNRIVAGVSDAVIVVESATKGGSLITAEIAQSYNRQVWAFPGRVFDTYSSGCNMLIFKNKASLLTNAEDFCLEMGWTDDVQHQKQLSEGIQQELFADDYSAEEQSVLQALARDDSKQINVLAVETNIAIGELSSLLFSLEMKGAVQSLVGGRYKLRR